jgi:hypothetical protein
MVKIIACTLKIVSRTNAPLRTVRHMCTCLHKKLPQNAPYNENVRYGVCLDINHRGARNKHLLLRTSERTADRHGLGVRPAASAIEQVVECDADSTAMPVQAKNANEGLLELLIDERVAKWVDRTVEIAQPVRYVIQRRRDARRRRCRRTVGTTAAEADQQRQHVPRCPAQHERAEYDRYCAQGFARSVFLLLLLLQTQRSASVRGSGHLPVATRHEVPERRGSHARQRL